VAGKVTRKDVSEYRAQAKKDGRDVSHLTDDQIAGQIRILKGGLHSPAPADLEEILARATKTEQVFRQCRQDVLSELERAVQDLRPLDSAPPPTPKRRTSSVLPAIAKRVVALQRSLLAYPPSLLSPDVRQALELVDSWAQTAARVLKGDRPKGASELGRLSGKLAALVEGLQKTAP